MSRFVARAFDLLASLKLSCLLILLLFALTWLGTLHQVEHGLFAAQQTYFDSWWLRQPIWGPLAVPLPGGIPVMALLFVNLVCGGILRLRRTWSRAGILIGHLGIAFLLVAGFVKTVWANEGTMRLFEGESASEYVSPHEWEIAILEPRDDGSVREYLIPQRRFAGLTGGEPRTFAHPELPFALSVRGFCANARPRPGAPLLAAGAPVVDGISLQPLPPAKSAELNRAGCYVTARFAAGGAAREGILWATARAPWTVAGAGGRWGVELRRKRWQLPFTIHLDDFTRVLHPGTSRPKAFMSDVTVVEGDVLQPVKIRMNEPLRRGDVIVFQSSWGPQDARPGQRLYSGFAVVRNPADQWPLYACLIIAVGLLVHFGRSLLVYVRNETRTAP